MLIGYNTGLVDGLLFGFARIIVFQLIRIVMGTGRLAGLWMFGWCATLLLVPRLSESRNLRLCQLVCEWVY